MDKLALLQERAEERELNPVLIERAKVWITAMQQERGGTWREPQKVFYDDINEEHVIEITWYKPRCVEINITLFGAIYDKFDNDEDIGAVNTPEERADLWQWLTAESETHV